MPRRPPEKTTFINPLPVEDLLVSGKELGLPMVDYIAANHRFSAGRMSWHSHDGHEILLLLSGTTGYEFRGGRKLQLRGSEIMVIPSGTTHRGQKDMRLPSTLCAIVFEPSHHPRQALFTKRECDWLASHFEQRTPQPVPMNVGTRHLAKTLHALIRQHATAKNTDGLLAALRVTVASIILEAARHHEQSRPAAHVSMAAQLIDHMERHLSEPISMDALARHARTSRARLFANFKRETGMSPNDWLQRRRIKAATDLLRTTNRKLEDIAAACGFTSAPYFCHVFRKYTGTTPSVHRKR
jgi:AraC-like DNA-binding protein/mannose-6-phosphate isomerase-like protein (cupin superfamily)